jgi:hypothetical protein
MDLKILTTIEEQVAVRFTGKVNILSNFNRQYLGHVLFKDGEVIQVLFEGRQGLKALYHLLIQEYSLQSYQYVVEPEIVEESERKIHYPYTVLKNKMGQVLKQYRESLKSRPPENVKILINAGFLASAVPVSSNEFKVLDSLTEWSRPGDIYLNCPLLDHEITDALVGLRKKGGLKIIAPKSIPS